MFNVPTLHAQHKRFVARVNQTLTREATEAGPFAQTHVRNHPRGYKHRTGNLIQKTGFRVVKTAAGRKLVVRNTAKYAAAIDRGARPHIIRPKRAKFLSFIGRGGNRVFARFVRHPGNKPTRFLLNATMATGRVFSANVTPALTRDAQRFNRIRIRAR